MKWGLKLKDLKRSQSLLKRPESVLVVVATKTQVLCLKRRDFDFWQSVTGSLLPDEKPLMAATRELYEETALGIDHGQLVDCQQNWWFDIYPHWLHRYPKGVTKNLEHVFLFYVEKPIDIILSDEHVEYCWLSKSQAKETMSSETNILAIEKFL